jgi:rSAM/selenodomain-associated transferase 1
MTICIFAKEPIPGRVKTRLAAAIGDEPAARLAQAFLADTIALVRSVGLPLVLAWSGRPEAAPRGVEVWSQGEGDLGERLERVLARALTASRSAIALGADSPGLPSACLRAAVDGLQTHDAVMGPADDGGYYLLGVTRVDPGLLDGIEWSAPTTREQTVGRLVARGHRVAMLPPWFDVDEKRDLARLTSLLRRGAARADVTACVLGIATRADEGAAGGS